MVLPNGLEAFDLRKGDNQICAYGQKEKCIVETPVRFGGGVYNCNSIGAFTFFNGDSNIRYVDKIGRFCMIGPNVIMGMPEHSTRLISGHILFYNQDSEHFLKFCNYLDNNEDCIKQNMRLLHNEKKELILIGNDVWIGCNTIITRGVKIGDGAVIAAGSVVTKDVEPYTIVGGVPAKMIRHRFDYKTIARLLELQWWQYGPDIMRGIVFSDTEKAIRKLEKRSANTVLYQCYTVLFDGINDEIKVISPNQNRN